MLDLGIDLNVWPWIWLGVAVVFAVVELTVLGGSFVLLPWAVSAFVAALLGFYDVPAEAQWAVFVLGGAALFGLFYRWARSFVERNALPPGVGAHRLVGAVGIVTVAITPDDVQRKGRVVVDGEVWGALTTGSTAVPEGSRVRVTQMQGTRVVVEPVSGSTGGETESSS